MNTEGKGTNSPVKQENKCDHDAGRTTEKKNLYLELKISYVENPTTHVTLNGQILGKWVIILDVTRDG